MSIVNEPTQDELQHKTRMHSSRMRTARSSSRQGGGGFPPGTPGTRPPRTSPPLVDRHTPVNILPCPKLRLRAVITFLFFFFLNVVTFSIQSNYTLKTTT